MGAPTCSMRGLTRLSQTLALRAMRMRNHPEVPGYFVLNELLSCG